MKRLRWGTCKLELTETKTNRDMDKDRRTQLTLGERQVFLGRPNTASERETE